MLVSFHNPRKRYFIRYNGLHKYETIPNRSFGLRSTTSRDTTGSFKINTRYKGFLISAVNSGLATYPVCTRSLIKTACGLMRSTVHMTTHKSQVMNAASVKWGRVTQIVHNAIIPLPGSGKLARHGHLKHSPTRD